MPAASVLAAEEVKLLPDRGAVGDTIDLTGTGFKSYTADVYFYFSAQPAAVYERLDDGVNVYKLIKKARSDSNGNIKTQFQIPGLIDEGTVGAFEEPVKVTTGTYYIFAAYADSDQIQVVAPFIVRGLTLNADSALPGDTLTVSGIGFTRNVNVALTFSGTPLTNFKAAADGSFTAQISVPQVRPGIYTIRAEDKLGRSAQLPFTVSAAPVASLSFAPATSVASPAFVGQELTLNGAGFTPDSAITIAYNKKLITTLDSDASGAFSYVYIIPSQTAGQYVLTADDGTNLLSASYVIESEAPASPVLLSPGEGAEAMAQLSMDWKDVSDKSLPVSYLLQLSPGPDFAALALEKADLAQSSYSFTSDEFARLSPSTYYWRVRAFDGAFNPGDWSEVRSFKILESPEPTGPPSTVPPSNPVFPNLKWVLAGLGIILVGTLSIWLIRKAVSRSRGLS